MSAEKEQPIVSEESNTKVKVIVATSVMLSFISFWRAAAIVLNDLGSSAFYAGGIAEQAVGASAPWFILGVMLFSYAVRAVYVESCAMFTRGGVYRTVKQAMGGTLAKASVSALMFDYILTGPISGVSAGQYIVGLATHLSEYLGHPWTPDKGAANLIAAGIAALITLYFWRRNTQGVHESSDDALKIMYVVSAMIVIMIAWAGVSIALKPEAQRLPPSPVPSHLSFTREAIGWIPPLVPRGFVPSVPDAPVVSLPPPATLATPDQAEPRYGVAPGAGMLIGLIGILIAFGHSFLAMSGEESLAQVNRELEYPKHKNLMRAGLVIFVYSLLFTSMVSFIAYALIPDGARLGFADNLISGIAMYLVGPTPLKLAFQAFIVLVGSLMLAGAVNTAIIGSNGVLNRVSEDGVMTDWFRKPHRRFGTTYRMINLIVILQLITIIGSRGNVYVLGEAYAFGVVWSFAFNALSMLVLRFQDRSPREWMVPLNIKAGKYEIPIGIALITLLLFTVAGINLLTKQIATVSGLAFTGIFFALFWISERLNERKRGSQAHVELDQFMLAPKNVIDAPTVSVRPGCVLCLVRDYNTLGHLRAALEQVDVEHQDFVVMTIRRQAGPHAGYKDIDEHDLFSSYEQLLFTKVVALAEKAGKHVELLVVPSSNVFQAIALTASQLQAAEIVAGRSSVMEAAAQARLLGQGWESVPQKPPFPVRFRIFSGDGTYQDFYLGAHAPELAEADVELIHRLWLEISQEPGHEGLHHHEVVTYALLKMWGDLKGPHRPAVLKQLGKTRPDY